MEWIKRHHFPLLLFLVYIFCVIYVSPFKDFPLNDDWAYSWSVGHLLQYKELKISDWIAPTSIFHIIWGAMFVKLLGNKYSVFRLATLIMSFLGSLFFYKTLKKIGMDEIKCIWGTLIFLFNPVFFCLVFLIIQKSPFCHSALFQYFCILKRRPREINGYGWDLS